MIDLRGVLRFGAVGVIVRLVAQKLDARIAFGLLLGTLCYTIQLTTSILQATVSTTHSHSQQLTTTHATKPRQHSGASEHIVRGHATVHCTTRLYLFTAKGKDDASVVSQG
jgi:hypothetical protein